jgi:hypothetical protein
LSCCGRTHTRHSAAPFSNTTFSKATHINGLNYACQHNSQRTDVCKLQINVVSAMTLSIVMECRIYTAMPSVINLIAVVPVAVAPSDVVCFLKTSSTLLSTSKTVARCLFLFIFSGCEAALAAKSQGIDKLNKPPSSYLPDLTHGVNSSFYEFKCSDKNSNGVHHLDSQYAEHFYEQPMVVFPPKCVSVDVFEKSPFLPNTGTFLLHRFICKKKI